MTANAASKTIAAISNPRSGKNKRGGFEKFIDALKEYPEIPHFILKDSAELYAVMQQCQEQRIDIIVVNGGDGTLQLVLTFLRAQEDQAYNPQILLLRAGTTSMSFGDVGCRG